MTVSQTGILVVDDDTIVRESICELLETTGHRVFGAGSAGAAMNTLAREHVALAISDINMPQSDGFELLSTIRQRYPHVVTLLITGYGTIESAVDAIKLGAFDYLTKPVLDDDLELAVQRGLQHHALLAENAELRHRLEQHDGLGTVIGQDPQMTRVFELVESVADSRITVLLSGESGTGKSMVARALHRSSVRAEAPFVEVSCGALPETLLESELFGHIKGAFTGAVSDKAGKFKAADGGTLFLDEIATASPALQVKLLRVIQERQFEPVGSEQTSTVDVRVVLATNVDLEAEVAAGRFREDLYYRVNVVNVVMPPLRTRIGDVALLADTFIERACAELNRPLAALTPAALARLESYDWPGNVRELQNAMERAVVLARSTDLDISDLPPKMRDLETAPAMSTAAMSLQDALAAPEKHIIEEALRSHAWNRQATAAALQINRTTLYKKMKKYGLDAAQQ
jgi:DNA-binding NtrC family response regulator